MHTSKTFTMKKIHVMDDDEARFVAKSASVTEMLQNQK